MSEPTRKEKVLRELSDGRWHEGYELCHPAIGGSEGLRRLRELRADGVEIEKRQIRGSSAYEYRLAGSEDDPLDGCTCLWDHTDRFQVVYVAGEDCPVDHPRIVRKETS